MLLVVMQRFGLLLLPVAALLLKLFIVFNLVLAVNSEDVCNFSLGSSTCPVIDFLARGDRRRAD